MIEFTISWFVTTFFIVISFYFYSKMYFFKTLFIKTKTDNNNLKEKTINDSALLEIFESEINKNTNNLEYLENELVEAFLIIKEYKDKNNSLKTELAESEDRIKTMKSKLDMLF